MSSRSSLKLWQLLCLWCEKYTIQHWRVLQRQLPVIPGSKASQPCPQEYFRFQIPAFRSEHSFLWSSLLFHRLVPGSTAPPTDSFEYNLLIALFWQIFVFWTLLLTFARVSVSSAMTRLLSTCMLIPLHVWFQ